MNDQAARARLTLYAEAYPMATARDLLKYLHQGAFGCGHIVASREAATEGIRREAAKIADTATDGRLLPLLGGFFRLPLTALREGLSPATLGALLALSATSPTEGEGGFRLALGVARAMTAEGAFAFSEEELAATVAAWEADGRPTPRHSEVFHREYHPAYRVIAARYRPYLPLLAAIDMGLADKGRLLLAIEGGSAAGKTTLASLLEELYGCTVFHMDDFFLRPEQRTPERFREPGGNVDRERFLAEVLTPLRRGEAVGYRRYDCGSGTLLPPVTVTPTPLTVIEGAYCMHPALADAYGLSVFLDIDPARQRERIEKRNTPHHAHRYLTEWIPMEHRYFEVHRPRERCTMTLTAE